jgi:DNA-binding NarL/FixJ family response regulator
VTTAIPATSRASGSQRRAPPLITIVLADDQNVVRRGIRCLLELEKDFKVVGEADDGLRVVDLVRRMKPRVLIVAAAMRGLNGLEVTRRVRQQSATTAVLVLSMYSNDAYVIQALRNGASAYVVKQAKPTELVRAIRSVVAGRRYLSAPLSEQPMETWLRRAKSTAPDAYETLSGRERQVLQFVFEGFTSGRIAVFMSISRRTAESYRASIMRKLHLSSLADLIRYVLARDILVPSS